MNPTQTPTQTTHCKNIFIEDDGYCTSCGKHHFRNGAVTSKNMRTAYNTQVAKTRTTAYVPPTAQGGREVFITPNQTSHRTPVSPAPAVYSPYRTSKPAPAPAPVSAPVYNPAPKVKTRSSDKNFTVAKEIVETVADLFGLDIQVVLGKSQRKSYCRPLGNGSFKIVFGSGVLAWFSENGYISGLAGCRNLAINRFGKYPTGDNAIKVHALHEVAHALTISRGHKYERHGYRFYQAFNELLDLAF